MNSSAAQFALGEIDLLKDPIVTDPQGNQYYVEPGCEPLDKVLAASTEYKDLSQFVQKDSDFLWTGLGGSQSGEYLIQITLPDGRQLSSAPVRSSNLVGNAQFPVAIWPAVRIPAGGKLGIYLKDISAAPNTIQIVFYGVRLYRVRGR